MPFILIILAFLILFSLSGVSAGTYDLDSSNSINDVQDVIDNDVDSELVINLANGNYNFNQIYISRNATIVCQSKNNVQISGNGYLFNISSSNVKFINLTISGYTNAIFSNSGGLFVIDCNITSRDVSVHL